MGISIFEIFTLKFAIYFCHGVNYCKVKGNGFEI